MLDAILERYSNSVYLVPMKFMDHTVTSSDDLQTRLKLIFETTFEACLDNRPVVVLTWREQITPAPLLDFLKRFQEFIDENIERGFIRQQIDSQMITGFLFDRIMNQVQLAPWLKENFDIDLQQDKAYRARWCAANIDIFLNGLMNHNI